MASTVKLSAEILNEKDIARLDDYTWRLYIEVVLYAAMIDDNGILPDTDELLWYLRKQEPRFSRSMQKLIQKRLVAQTTQGYLVPDWQSFTSTSDSTSAERVRRYRERRKQNNGGVDDWSEARDFVLSRDSNICMYCNNIATAVDHIVPVAKGGTNDPCNLVACCQSCNSSKGDKDMECWYRSQPFFNETTLTGIYRTVMRVDYE